MNAKFIIRLVLLAVVALAVGHWAFKEFGPSKPASGHGMKEGAASAARPDGVTVIYFHGEKRCRTCIRIGELARKVVEEEFAAEVRTGNLRWEEINYEEPARAHHVKGYELVSSTVVVTRWRDGKELKWKKLDGVWDHAGDEVDFRAYVANGVREFLNP
jgi:hypothetical protein